VESTTISLELGSTEDGLAPVSRRREDKVSVAITFSFYLMSLRTSWGQRSSLCPVLQQA
jgi:hypothetical protein